MRRHDRPAAAAATWRNWAGNESARPRRIATPRSAQEAAEEVRRARADGLTVRMAGTGHSFTPWRISFPIEVRVTPGDDPWLSTAYGRDSAYIAIHVFHASPHQEYFGDIEAVMTAAAGRPHWGKMHTMSAQYLRQAYPKHRDFVALR